MPEQKAFLEKVHIKNFLSLRNVTLPFKPLTVLVGPNASGKSNVLSALKCLKDMMVSEIPPQIRFIQKLLWVGEARDITFRLHTEIDKFSTEYQLVLSAEIGNPFVIERLLVNDTKVISIQDGQGEIWDEDGTNQIVYKSKKLALQSAGDYGSKPTTSRLTTFIKEWYFYHIQPGAALRYLMGLEQKEFSDTTKFDDEISALSSVLSSSESVELTINALFCYKLSQILLYWYKNAPERARSVNESLEASMRLKVDFREINEDSEILYLLDEDNKLIPLDKTSAGTLRLLAYYILLNLPEFPPLIAIEEPERNLHPGALKDIAYILEKLAERTQVIITTHSSQLLDTFNSDDLSDSPGVLLLRNRPGLGTEVLNLEEIRGKQKALEGWIADFGIGSAVFNSGLLQDLMEEPI